MYAMDCHRNQFWFTSKNIGLAPTFSIDPGLTDFLKKFVPCTLDKISQKTNRKFSKAVPPFHPIPVVLLRYHIGIGFIGPLNHHSNHN